VGDAQGYDGGGGSARARAMAVSVVRLLRKAEQWRGRGTYGGLANESKMLIEEGGC
jgi:hypothetical protein